MVKKGIVRRAAGNYFTSSAFQGKEKLDGSERITSLDPQGGGG